MAQQKESRNSSIAIIAVVGIIIIAAIFLFYFMDNNNKNAQTNIESPNTPGAPDRAVPGTRADSNR